MTRQTMQYFEIFSSGGYESPSFTNRYTLFAVINHIGNIEAGHYVSYVRQHRDRWYRCNDHQIVPATIKEVSSIYHY